MSPWKAGVLFGGLAGIAVGVILTIAWALMGASKTDEVRLSETTRRADEAWERLRLATTRGDRIDDEDLDHVPDEWTS